MSQEAVETQTSSRMSLEEFLKIPEEQPWSEWWGGEVRPKTGGTFRHGYLMGEFSYLLLKDEPLDRAIRAFISLRHLNPARDFVFLPDITVFRKERLPRTLDKAPDPMTVMPDFVIEILEQDDASGLVLRRVDAYLDAGIPLIWLVAPENEAVFTFDQSRQMLRAPHDQPLSAAPILPGFELDIPALFAVLHIDV